MSAISLHKADGGDGEENLPDLGGSLLCKRGHSRSVWSSVLGQAGGDLDHVGGALLGDHHRVVERRRERILLRLQREGRALGLKRREPEGEIQWRHEGIGGRVNRGARPTCVRAELWSRRSVCCWD